MDAGIIAAFKRHYRQYYLQNAVDRDERGEPKTDSQTCVLTCGQRASCVCRSDKWSVATVPLCAARQTTQRELARHDAQTAS